MRRAALAVVLAAVALLVVLSTFVSRSDRERAQSISPSTFNTGIHGAAAAYELVGRLGYEQVRWGQPLHRLENLQGVLIVAAPLRMPVSEAESQALRRWLMRGGTCLYFRGADVWNSHLLGPLDRLAGLNPGSGADSPWSLALERLAGATITADLSMPHRYARAAFSLAVERDSELPPAGYGLLPLYHIKDGRTVAGLRRIGQGRMIVVGSSKPVSRGALASADNADFLLAVIRAHVGGGAVIWDEFHHGFRDRYPAAALASRLEVRLILAHLGLAAVLYAWSRGRRYGSPLAAGDAPPRPLREFVRSLADLHRRSTSRREALEILFRRHCRDLAERLGCAPGASPGDIRDAMRHHGLSFAETAGEELSRIAQLLQRAEVSRWALLAAARTLHRIEADLRKETW